MLTPFIDLFRIGQKEDALASAIRCLTEGAALRTTTLQRIERFAAIEGSPFAFRVPGPVLELARRGSTLSSHGVAAHQGIGASTRFHRLAWEVRPNSIGASQRWKPMAHGSKYSPFYKSTDHVFLWADDGREAKADVNHRYPYLKGNYGFKIQSEDHYFKAGFCYGKRTNRFSVQVMPEGHVFSFEGTAIFWKDEQDAWPLLGLLNSAPVAAWLNEVCAQHKAYNYVNGVPCPALVDERLGPLARRGWKLMFERDSAVETTRAFYLPAVLQTTSPTLTARAAVVQDRLNETECELAGLQHQIDEIALDLYGLEAEDRRTILESLGEGGVEAEADVDGEEVEEDVDGRALAVELLSYCVGAVFGRFDVRYATGELAAPELPDPFAPLPACSPGMLTGDDGLPMCQQPGDYPLRVSWDGVLVHDPGLDDGRPHREDIVARVREVLALLFSSHAEEIEHEACALLGAKTLRDFFAKPSGFFAEHLRRYSKGRRQAPIYWPLSTTSGSYTLWLYYHRLNDDLLYTAVNRYVEPKASEVQRRLNEIAAALPMATGRQAGELRKEHEELSTLQAELTGLREELLRVAALPYKPDLDDGVLICASPLARLFRLTKWRKDLEACWKKLERGDYDWAHLAYAIWPERVLEACRRDRSIAIAHGVEERTAE